MLFYAYNKSGSGSSSDKSSTSSSSPGKKVCFICLLVLTLWTDLVLSFRKLLDRKIVKFTLFLKEEKQAEWRRKRIQIICQMLEEEKKHVEVRNIRIFNETCVLSVRNFYSISGRLIVQFRT